MKSIKYKILILDDNETALAALKDLIKTFASKISTAKEWGEALISVHP